MSEIARTGKWNPGGGRWLDVVAASDVASYVRASPATAPVITLKTDKEWTRIYCTPGTLAYKLSADTTDNGPLFTIEIKGFSPDDSASKGMALITLFIAERMLVRFTDNSGLVRIAGTPIETLLFSYDLGTDDDVPGQRGYALNLKGTLTQRPAYA